MHFKTIIFSVFLVLSSSISLAQDTTLSSGSLHTKELKSTSSGEDTQRLCRHVKDFSGVSMSDISPSLFRDVEKVFMRITRQSYEELNELYFDQASLTRLSECIIKKHLSPLRMGTKGEDVSVFIPERNIPVENWPEIDNEANLFIWIDLGIRAPRANVGEKKISIVRVRYFRKGRNNPSDLKYQCSEPFIYSENSEERLERLTVALSTCLTVPYTQKNQ